MWFKSKKVFVDEEKDKNLISKIKANVSELNDFLAQANQEGLRVTIECNGEWHQKIFFNDSYRLKIGAYRTVQIE